MWCPSRKNVEWIQTISLMLVECFCITNVTLLPVTCFNFASIPDGGSLGSEGDGRLPYYHYLTLSISCAIYI